MNKINLLDEKMFSKTNKNFKKIFVSKSLAYLKFSCCLFDI